MTTRCNEGLLPCTQSLSAARPANRSRLNNSCLALQQLVETTPISRNSPVCRTEKLPFATPKGTLKLCDQSPLVSTAGECLFLLCFFAPAGFHFQSFNCFKFLPPPPPFFPHPKSGRKHQQEAQLKQKLSRIVA